MKKLLFVLLACFPMSALAVDCHISEYAYVTMVQDGQVAQAVREPPLLQPQRITFTTTSTQSAVFHANTRVIRIICSAKTHFEIGANPTASTADSYVAQDTAEYFGVSTTGLRIALKDST